MLSLKDSVACVIREDLDDVLLFGEGKLLEGSAEEWWKLEEVLEKKRTSKWDGGIPSGGLVGVFHYDGTFQFYVSEEVQSVGKDVLLPQDKEMDEVLIERQTLPWREGMGREEFVQAVEAVKEYIRAGELYQVNLARSYRLEGVTVDPLEYFRHLWQVTEAPRGAFLRFPNRALMSASPELFLQVDGRQVVTQPIKGTRPRDRDRSRDERNAFELSTDEKEVAELIMITDLERNDLGSICEYGSVEIRDLVARRCFSHVFHLLSTVEGQLRKDVNAVGAVKGCFPGGSITGAPKLRAMDVIQELENEPRDFFTGAIGYFGFDGSAHFNIAIRTAEYAQGVLRFFVGSGITIGSDGDKEFEETEHKAAALLQASEVYFSKTHAMDKK